MGIKEIRTISSCLFRVAIHIGDLPSQSLEFTGSPRAIRNWASDVSPNKDEMCSAADLELILDPLIQETSRELQLVFLE